MSIATEKRAQRAAVERAMRDPSPLTAIMGAFAVALGVTITLGGREAWGGAEYTAALFVPGAPESWGWVIAAFGLLVIIGKIAFNRNRAVLYVGLVGVGFWHVVLAISFVISASTSPGIGWAQFVIHLFIAVMYVYRYSVYRRPPINIC